MAAEFMLTFRCSRVCEKLAASVGCSLVLPVMSLTLWVVRVRVVPEVVGPPATAGSLPCMVGTFVCCDSS